jgi:hypothetical protein
MADITELERRIAAAFDRIDRGLEGIIHARAQTTPPAPAAPETAAAPAPELAALMRALELAKASTQDWADRYSALQQQMSDETLAMASEIARLSAELDQARSQTSAPPPADPPASDDEMDALLARLAAQETELETLRAAHSRDSQELGEIIAALAPLVEETSDV